MTTPTTAAVTGTETTLPVTTFTTAPAVSAEITGETAVPTGITTTEITNPPATAPGGNATAQPDTYGALSITTTPAGAFIFIDGVQRGVSPATIPGLPAGIHTLLLKLDGYQDLSTPITITAGTTQDYATALAKNTETGTTRSPGFEFIPALCALGAVIRMRTRS
ncbi:MAG TPA: PEGA domain-containing protein [Methanoregula sp.]|nr:PEGA domain-containing protein [Methanoregula sp.]